MRCLGKQPPRHDPRTLKLARYLSTTAPLPPAPPSRDWSSAAAPNWGMLGNDALGDCTCAAAGHLIQTWTANHGREITPTDLEIVAAYSAITGYSPALPSSDQGAVEIDVLNHWRTDGIAGNKIGAYAWVDPANKSLVEAGINLCGGVYCGAALSVSAQSQTVWDVTDGPEAVPGSWGGHAMAVVGYNATGVVLVTWGAIKIATWAWWLAYVDEAYAILDDAWVNGSTPSPNGFDLAALQTDLGAL